MKIGRNKPCPCGSGKKYKHCHWLTSPHGAVPTANDTSSRLEVLRVQRERQQGLGRPIISTQAFGRRFVAVKSRLLHSQKWKTFHDFLLDYIKAAMGMEWGSAEIAKPMEQRHPILAWYHQVCRQQQDSVPNCGDIHSAPMTGAIAAYLQLAYDLYALDHNADLQTTLIKRLRDSNNFAGARYEVFVAATLIRAGFEIDFENESDGSRTHCEFTATYKATGKQFSVEAKHRAGNSFRLGRQLNRALAKQADHARIVFIDINVPDAATDGNMPDYFRKALKDIRVFEGRIINGKPLPSAYIVVTNTPWHHFPDTRSFRCAAMAEGFQIQDFKMDAQYPSLRAAIESRDRHKELNGLLRSMKEHARIPSTFDGEIPEFAFGENRQPRLLIGHRYMVEGQDGGERPGLLTTATVAESECKAICALSFEDGTAGVYSWPLSAEEMNAWRTHPDTFFGEVGQRSTEAKDPLELYDFFLNGYRQTPRERLLELMADADGIEALKGLEQSALASIYAERLVNSAMARDRYIQDHAENRDQNRASQV